MKFLVQGPFWPPLSTGDGRNGPTGFQNTSTQCVWVGRIHIMRLGPLTDLYCTPGAPKGPVLAPKSPFWGSWKSSEGPQGPDLVPTVANWSDWVGIMVARPGIGPLLGPQGPQKGPFWPQKPLLGVLEVLGGPPGARFGPNCRQLVRLGWSHGYHTLWPGIGPFLGPQGHQKGPFWP